MKFVLVGTVVGESRSLAFLQEPSLTGNGVLRVPLGERIGPYRLTKVLGDRVELQGPTGLLTVRLGGMAGGAPSSAPPPPTPPVVTAAPATGPPPPDLIETLPRQMGFGAVLEEAARRAP